MNRLSQWIKVYPYWSICGVAILIVSAYWSFLATDRYVSETHVVMQNPAVSPIDINLTAMMSGGGAANDLLLLADHLSSVDMLLKLDKKLNLRAHYSDKKIDFLSRLSAFNDPIESFHDYYLKRVHISLDDYAGVLVIKAEAYSPEKAQQITKLLLQEGESHMNKMGQRLALEQLSFIENQVQQLNERLMLARDNLLNYQNTHGLVSPTSTVESLNIVVAGLESELAKAHAKKIALSDYLSKKSPEIVRQNSEISALKQQIRIEKAKMTTNSGSALNTISAEYETLQLQAEFALKLYSNALVALETTRVEAIRKLKQVSVLQAPTHPEYSIEPRRLYNVSVFAIFAIFLTLIFHMLLAIVYDHRD